jgi:hypothetical protein
VPVASLFHRGLCRIGCRGQLASPEPGGAAAEEAGEEREGGGAGPSSVLRFRNGLGPNRLHLDAGDLGRFLHFILLGVQLGAEGVQVDPTHRRETMCAEGLPPPARAAIRGGRLGLRGARVLGENDVSSVPAISPVCQNDSGIC